MLTKESLNGPFEEQVTRARKNSPDGSVTVTVVLQNGARYTVWSMDTAKDWVALEAFEDGKRPIENTRESVEAGADRYAFDRIIVPYEQIAMIRVTARRPASDTVGFHSK